MRIYLAINGEAFGPHSVEEIGALLQAGEISEGTSACVEGSDEWAALSEFVDIQQPPPASQPTRPVLLTGPAPTSSHELTASPDLPENIITHKKTCPFCGAKKTRRAPADFQPGGIQLYPNRSCPKCHAIWKRSISESVAQIEFLIVGIGSLLVMAGTLFAIVGLVWSLQAPEEIVTEELVEAKKSTGKASLQSLFYLVPLLIAAGGASFAAIKRLLNKKNRSGEVLNPPIQLQSQLQGPPSELKLY